MLKLSLLSLFIAGTNAAICGRINNRQDCVSRGCDWSGSCRQPSACNTPSDSWVKHRYDSAGRVENTGVRIIRAPIAPEVAQLCDTLPICTARYSVSLSRKWTSGGPNCNDYGMLPPHGVDQRECLTLPKADNLSVAEPNPAWTGQHRVTLRDYVHYPLVNDGVQQSIAKAKNLVTALTVETEECNKNPDCAFPYGYYSDTIKRNHAVCVSIYNAENKWVEVMASSKGGSDAAFCAEDMDQLSDTQEPGCTLNGDLVFHRESGVNGGDPLNIMFLVKDNFDDANIDFYWRIAASYELSHDESEANKDVEKDAEDWSQYRDGAQFPEALMPAYPIGYEEPAVFEKESTDAASFTSPSSLLLLLSMVIAYVTMYL